MIKLLQHGSYTLIETKSQTKILTLDEKAVYAWVVVEDIGEILVCSHNPHETDHLLAADEYAIYQVEKEDQLVDTLHLELKVGPRTWQGYLLLTGLPTEKKKRSRIIPTDELVHKK